MELAHDPVGLMYGNVILARDGKHYAYRLRRVFSRLNVVEGSEDSCRPASV